jgi:hypothetical protein
LKQWQIGALFGAGLVVGGTVVWLLTRSSGSSPHADAPSSTRPVIGPQPGSSSAPAFATNAQDLLHRLDASNKATFHVRYTTGSASGSHAILEVWHTADRVRRDLTAISTTEGTAHTEEILANKKYVRCVQFQGQDWQCVGAPTSTAGTLTDPLQGAAPDLTGRKVTLTHAVIVGKPVRCYTVAATSAKTKPSQFCLTDDNVPLRIDGGDGKPVEATNYDSVVPNSVFTPPATVAGS